MSAPAKWPEGTVFRNNGRPLTISWSAIESFDHARGGCNRKWWYGYMESKRTSSEATIVGGKVHDTAEAYLNGEEMDIDSRWYRILEPGLEYAPTPTEIAEDGWGVEQGWRASDILPDDDGVVKGLMCGPLIFAGKVDFYHIVDAIVSDWKSSGAKAKDPTTGKTVPTWKYSKNEAQLATLGQPLLYSYALLNGDAHPDEVSFQHINLFTKGTPSAMEVWAHDVPWSEVEEMWETAEGLAKQMAAIATNHETADTLEYNPKSCKAFGGCPHAEYCTASPRNRNTKTITISEPTMSGNTAEVLAKQAALRKKLGLPEPAGAPTPAPVNNTKPVATQAPAPTEPVSGMAKAKALLATVLAGMRSIPAVVLENTARQHGLDGGAVVAAMSLKKEGAFYVPTGDKPPAPKPKSIPGCPRGVDIERVAELAKAAGVTVEEVMAHNSAKFVAGITVPQDFEGSDALAILSYSTDPVAQAIAAEALTAAAENDAHEAPTEEVKVATGGEVATVGVTRSVEANSPQSDNDVAADAVLAAVQAAGGSMTKAKAAVIVKSVFPEMKRVRAGRWEDIILASKGALAFEGNKVVANFAETPEDFRTAALGELEALVVANPPTADVVVINTEPTATHQDTPLEVAPTTTLVEDIVEALLHDRVHKEVGNARPANSHRMVSDLMPTIYIDAMPVNEDFTDFANWIAPHEDAIADEFGKLHYSMEGFGKGRAAVVGRIKSILHREGPAALPSALVVDTSHPLAFEIVPLFQRLKGSVRFVRGTK